MADFPTSLDTLTDPIANDTLAAVPHHTQHATANDILEAVEAKLGIGASTPVLGMTLRATATGTSEWEGFTEVVLRAAGVGLDDAAAFRAAVAAATGPTVFLLPDPAYRFRTYDADTVCVAVNAPNIWFRGVGRTKPSNGVDDGSGGTTAILAQGDAYSDAATMFRWYADKGANTSDATDEVYGGGIRDLSINGNSGAGIGIEVQGGCVGQEFRNLHVSHFTTHSVLLGSGCTHSGSIHTWHSTSDIVFEHCTIRAFGSSNGVYLTGNPNVVGGEAAYDILFRECIVNAVNGDAYVAHDCDDIFVIGGAATTSGTGVAVRVKVAGATKASGGRAFQVSNSFGSWMSSVVEAGSGSLRSGRGPLLLGASTEDITSHVPTMGAGAHAFYLNNNGRHNLVPDLRTHALLTDDFLGGTTSTGNIGDRGWFLSAGTVTQIAAEADHPGIIRLATGAVINTVAALAPSASTTAGMVLPSESFDIQWIFRLGQADVDTRCLVGLGMNPFASPPADGIYIELLGSSSLIWQIRARAATVNTTTSTSTTATTDWVRLRIKRRSDTLIGVAFGDTTNENDTWTVASPPTVTLNPFFWLSNLAAADKTADIDSCQLFVNGLSR